MVRLTFFRQTRAFKFIALRCHKKLWLSSPIKVMYFAVRKHVIVLAYYIIRLISTPNFIFTIGAKTLGATTSAKGLCFT